MTKVTQEKILGLKWSVLPHLTYTSDLVPMDYHILWFLTESFNGKTCINVEQVNQALDTLFQSKPTKFYGELIDKLPIRLYLAVVNNFFK
jgi:hypothetical protein